MLISVSLFPLSVRMLTKRELWEENSETRLNLRTLGTAFPWLLAAPAGGTLGRPGSCTQVRIIICQEAFGALMLGFHSLFFFNCPYSLSPHKTLAADSKPAVE